MTDRIAEIDDRIDDIEHEIAVCAEWLHLIEKVEQEHGDQIPADQRDEIRDEIENLRRRIHDLRIRATDARTLTPEVDE